MAPDIILLVAVAAVGIRMAVLHGRLRALEAQVIRDPLTGAFNRRHMQVTLAAAVEPPPQRRAGVAPAHRHRPLQGGQRPLRPRRG